MKRALVFGENVYLRPIEREDIDKGWLDWINDRAIQRHLASTSPNTRESLERYWAASQPPNATMFAICLHEDDMYIGNARLSTFDWISRKCRYGWIIGDSKHRGRGLGSEALVLLLRYGFHNLGMKSDFQFGHHGERSVTGQQRQGRHDSGRNSASGHLAQRQFSGHCLLCNAARRIRPTAWRP